MTRIRCLCGCNMNKIATISVEASALLQKGPAQLGLVFWVELAVLLQLVLAVRELALAVVGAESVFHIFFAELWFLFARTARLASMLQHLARRSLRSLGGWRVVSALLETWQGWETFDLQNRVAQHSSRINNKTNKSRLFIGICFNTKFIKITLMLCGRICRSYSCDPARFLIEFDDWPG